MNADALVSLASLLALVYARAAASSDPTAIDALERADGVLAALAREPRALDVRRTLAAAREVWTELPVARRQLAALEALAWAGDRIRETLTGRGGPPA